MRKKIYINGISSNNYGISQNPYLDDLSNSLQEYFDVVNLNNKNINTITSLLKYFGKYEFVYFNWLEELPYLRYGTVQSIIVLIFLIVFRIVDIKVIWTLHNRTTHQKKKKVLGKVLFKYLVVYSDVVISHTKEGIDIIKGFRKKGNVYYIPHPVKKNINKEVTQKRYDILIWGTIEPYKGVYEFLEYLKTSEKDYDICIAGKVPNAIYKKKISSVISSKTTLMDEYIENDVLEELILCSRLVLFPYTGESVLSSGALIETLRYETPIVGPNKGEFRDLAEINLVLCYDSYLHMISIIDTILFKINSNNVSNRYRENYLNSNSWEKYGEAMASILNRYN